MKRIRLRWHGYLLATVAVRPVAAGPYHHHGGVAMTTDPQMNHAAAVSAKRSTPDDGGKWAGVSWH